MGGAIIVQVKVDHVEILIVGLDGSRVVLDVCAAGSLILRGVVGDKPGFLVASQQGVADAQHVAD